MTSARQTAANRSNAASSSGPRSPEGKQKSSMNALRHGGTAALGVLPDEDPQEAVQLGQRLLEAYAPCGPDQEILVQLICDGLRRLQRLSRVESGILTWHLSLGLVDGTDGLSRWRRSGKGTPVCELGDPGVWFVKLTQANGVVVLPIAVHLNSWKGGFARLELQQALQHPRDAAVTRVIDEVPGELLDECGLPVACL